MRAILNAILAFIGAASLSDLEFATIDPALNTADAKATYLALLAVINSRGVSDFSNRLLYYFKAKGNDVVPPEAHSNILVGGSLE